MSEITNVASDLLLYGSEPRQHTVVDFLKRPEKIASVTWTTSQAALTNLVSLSIPSAILTTMYQTKLQGFGLLRADIVFKLQFNSQPFQAGRLIATYTPVPTYLANRKNQCFKTLQRLTALPNVIIDISKQTETNITIPYVSSFTHYDLTTGGGDWGQFDLWVYSPLNSASTQSINIAVRSYLENVQLGALTQQNLASQGTLSANLSAVRAQLQSKTPNTNKNSKTNGLETITMKEERSGPISSLGHDLRTSAVGALNAVGNYIPAISSLASVLNGASMGVLNAFAHFGLGKPTNLDKISPVVLHAFSNFASADGIDNGHSLGLRAGNKIMPLPGFAGSDTDELSLKYLMQTLQYIGHFSLTTSQSVGASVWSSQITPCLNDPDDRSKITVNYGGHGNRAVASPSLQYYIASNFKYWRGDLIFHIALIKTNYHSVRLKFVFDPLAQSTSSITYTNSEYCYSVVLDFRDKTDLYVRVPYVSPTPWKLVTPALSNAFGENPYPPRNYDGLGSYAGCVQLFIDNTLQASSAVVSQSIDALVEFCCAENFELGFPMGGNNFTPVSFVVASQNEPIRASLQSGYTSDGVAKTRSAMQTATSDIKSVTGVQPNPSETRVDDFTTGETIHSCRALIKRFNWVYQQPTTSQYTTFTPRVTPVLGTGPIAGEITTVQPYTASLYDVIGSLFAFSVGGIRYKVMNTTSHFVGAFLYEDIENLGYTSGTSPPTIAANLGNTPAFELDYSMVKGSFEFVIPYYGSCYARVNTFANSLTQVSNDVYFCFTQPIHNCTITTDAQGAAYIAKAGADDASFGFLLGVPDCIPSVVMNQTTGYVNPLPYLKAPA